MPYFREPLPAKIVTVQLSEEPRRRAGLNLPYGLAGALPRAELVPKISISNYRADKLISF